jgi:EmrB/QacA subfamily drug resistance transporter
MSGWLADKFGTRNIFIAAIVIFVIGSLCCAMSPNLKALVCSRILQGFGGSMLMPVGRLAVMRNFPNEKFLPAISFMTIPGLIGPILGPVLGGWLSEAFSWKLIFLINVPVGVVGAIATFAFMPNDKMTVRRFDIVGYLLAACSMTTLTISLSGADMSMPLGAVLALGAACAISLFLFVFYSVKAKAPLFPPAVFRVRTFTIGLTGNFFARMGSWSMPYLLPLLFQTNMNYSPTNAGLLMLPSAISGMLAKKPVTGLIRRCGYRNVLIWNTLLLGASMAMFAALDKGTETWLICVFGFFFGVFNSIQLTAMNTVALKDLPEDIASSGNGILSMMQMLSMSIAVVVAGLLLGAAQSGFSIGDDMTRAFHFTFIFTGTLAALSALIFARLRRDD